MEGQPLAGEALGVCDCNGASCGPGVAARGEVFRQMVRTFIVNTVPGAEATVMEMLMDALRPAQRRQVHPNTEGSAA